MHSCQYIEENICFSNGGTNLHIHTIAQGRPEENQVEFLQGPHGIVNPPKNLVLNNIRWITQMADGLLPLSSPVLSHHSLQLCNDLFSAVYSCFIHGYHIAIFTAETQN